MLNPNVPEPEKQSRPLKEMLTLTASPDSTTVKINFSSLDLIQTCLRKAHYSLTLGLRSTEESTALSFGSAIHKALEHWYQLSDDERVLPKSLEESAELLSFGQGLDRLASHGALEAIRQFCLLGQSGLAQLPETDKRSLQSGVRILRSYFKHYANDGFVVYRDTNGPLIERRVEFPIDDFFLNGKLIKVIYHGTIDCVLIHKDTKVVCVVDHKTTSALGNEFYQRCKPNHQYTGYVWLAKQALGIDTNMFMINGIQTAKTKTEFARQITERTEDDFFELQRAVLSATKRYLESGEFGHPMNSPNPCSMYGGCQYRKICELPEKMKEQVIKLEYK